MRALQDLYNMDFEDSGGFGMDAPAEEVIGALPTTQISQPLPVAQPVFQPVAEPITQRIPELAVEPVAQEFSQPVAEPVNRAVEQPILDVLPTPTEARVAQPVAESVPVAPLSAMQSRYGEEVSPIAQNFEDSVGALPITRSIAQPVAQPSTTAQTPAKPTGPSQETIDAIKKQILGQNLTSQWTGEGFGSAEANAADMAKILAGIGITDINQFGKITKTIPAHEEMQGSGEDSYMVMVPEQTVTTYGNKVTGQEVPNTYSERQTGDFFGGTFSGKGNTGYGVRFDAQGNPYFYTQGASSNDLANIMQDLGPLGQIGLAIATGGLSIPEQIAANMAIKVLSGQDIGDAVKSAAVSWAGAQIPGLDAIKEGTSFLNGVDSTGVLSNAFQNAAVSGAKAVLSGQDIGNAITTGALTGGTNAVVNTILGSVDGFQDLTKNEQKIVTNAVTGVISGKPLDQIVINSAIAAANASVANVQNPPTEKPLSADEQAQLIENRLNKAIVGSQESDEERDARTQEIISELEKNAQQPVGALPTAPVETTSPLSTVTPPEQKTDETTDVSAPINVAPVSVSETPTETQVPVIPQEEPSPLSTLKPVDQVPVEQKPDDTVDVSTTRSLTPQDQPVEPIIPSGLPTTQTPTFTIPTQPVGTDEVVVTTKKKDEETPTEPLDVISSPLSTVPPITIPTPSPNDVVVTAKKKEEEPTPVAPLEYPVTTTPSSNNFVPTVTIVGDKPKAQETPDETQEPLTTPLDTRSISSVPTITITSNKPPEETPTTIDPITTAPLSTVVPTTSSPTTPTASAPTATATTGGGGLSSSSSNYTPKALDSSAQFLKAAPLKKELAKLASLQQLYNSLTPEMQGVFADRGIEPPSYDYKSDLPPELTTEPMTTFAATGGSIFGDAAKVIDSMTPTYAKSATHLAAAPVLDQQSRLQPLKHLSEGPLKGAGMRGGLAHGGLPEKYAKAAPEGHKPEFITGLTGYYAQGGGTGQSDDIPAMLHDGDFVMDADTVAALGDGSSKAGAEVLEKMRKSIPQSHSHGGGSPVPAQIADGEYVFPASFVTAIGGGSNALGAKRLNEMREKIRAHKRSAPTTKIPPKAKSPLDYLKMAKG